MMDRKRPQMGSGRATLFSCVLGSPWVGCLLLLALLTLAPRDGVAGILDYPPSVAADYTGHWEVIINITNATDPGFQIDGVTNTSANNIAVLNLGGGHWRVTIGGRLVNLREDGQITFHADPDGAVTTGMIAIKSRIKPVPTLNGWMLALAALALCALGAAASRPVPRGGRY